MFRKRTLISVALLIGALLLLAGKVEGIALETKTSIPPGLGHTAVYALEVSRTYLTG